MFSLAAHAAIGALVYESVRDYKLPPVATPNTHQVLQISMSSAAEKVRKTVSAKPEPHPDSRKNQNTKPKTTNLSLRAASTEKLVEPQPEAAVEQQQVTKQANESIEPVRETRAPITQASGITASIDEAKAIKARNALIRERLNALINVHKKYPTFAIRRGWQGTVELGLRVEADGKLTRVRVLKTSGYRILDEAALTMLSSANHVNGIEAWLNGHYFDTTLPIEYRLTGG